MDLMTEKIEFGNEDIIANCDKSPEDLKKRREKLHVIRDKFVKRLDEHNSDIETLGKMITDLEDIINRAADFIGEKDLNDKAQEKYRKHFNRCRNAVGNLIWLQHLIKSEMRNTNKTLIDTRKELLSMSEYK